MKKHLIFTIMLCLLVFACTSSEKSEATQEETVASGIEFVKLSLQDALTQAQAKNKPILIDFFSPT